MSWIRRRAPWGAAALVVPVLLAAAPALAQNGNAYRGLPARDLVRVAERAPVNERPAILEAMLERRAETLPVLRQEARAGTPAGRLLAIGMMAEMRDDGGVLALLDAAADRDEGVQRAALAALRTLADPRAGKRFRQLVRTNGRGGALKIAAAGLGRIGTAADRALLRALLDNPDEGVRVHAAGALAMLGSDEGEAVLLSALDGDNPIAQKNATYALGFVRTPAARERLQRILDDPAGEWKSYALIALAQQRRASESEAEELAELALLGRGRDRIAADWAIEELTDLDIDGATELLRELGASRHGPLGTKARLRAKVREGR